MNLWRQNPTIVKNIKIIGNQYTKEIRKKGNFEFPKKTEGIRNMFCIHLGSSGWLSFFCE